MGLALGLAVCAWSVGIATHIYRGAFNPWALLAVTGGLLACVLGIFWPEARASWFQKLLLLFLPVAIFLETGLLLLNETNHGTTIQLAIVVLGLLGLMGALNLSGLRKVIAGIMLAGFLLVLLLGIFRGLSGIDVLMFQARGAEALWHGHNPYSFRYPNVYPPNTPFYGEGVVDASGHWLTYGFPYPPLSLLMSTLGWIVGDVRIAHALAAAATAGLMFAARPGRISALAAALFILTPLSVFVPSQSWTEPLLALNFSLVMFCACRAEKSRLLLPLALGLFLATKQYAVLSLPAVILLVGKGNQRRELGRLILIAGLVAGGITLPFLLWNPHAFIRSVVLMQTIQPFRPDAISYLAWIYHGDGQYPPPIWIPFAAMLAATALVLWRCPRTPAGYAAGVTLIDLTFFAFNKQAFPNYYYFVIVTACWALAATARGLAWSNPAERDVVA